MESNDKPQPSQNPEGDVAGSTTQKSPEGANTPPDELDRQAEKATEGMPIDREDIQNESAYKDDSADVGQQAAAADKAKKETEE